MRGIARAVIVLAFAAGAAGAGAEIVDRVLATVGSQIVTLSDLRAAQTFGIGVAGVPARTPDEILHSLVDRELMLGEVQRYVAPEPDRELVDRRMAQIRARFPNAGAYQQALARTAMTEDRLRSSVAADLQISAYVDQRFGEPAPPSSDEVQRYYLDHPAEFTRAGHLLPLSQVRDQAQELVAAARKRTLVAQWLDRLRRSTHVEINTGALAGVK
jgi:hypothetical protein